MKLSGKDIDIQRGLIRLGRLAAEQYEFVENPAEWELELKRSGFGIDLFTFLPRLSESERSQSYPTEPDNLAVLKVSTFDHWWSKQINGKTRNMVRRAEKASVVVREAPYDDDMVSGIVSVYNESPVRQGKKFWHYGKDFATVKTENGTFLERSVFIGAYLDDVLIGFAKVVSDEKGEQAGLMQIVSMIKERDKAPTNALIAQAVRSCAERGVKNLVYSKFSYGRKEKDSLADFKENNGFQRVDLPRYYIPCTVIGRAGFHLGLHRGVTSLLPESVLVRARRLRGSWLDRKRVNERVSSNVG